MAYYITMFEIQTIENILSFIVLPSRWVATHWSGSTDLEDNTNVNIVPGASRLLWWKDEVNRG